MSIGVGAIHGGEVEGRVPALSEVDTDVGVGAVCHAKSDGTKARQGHEDRFGQEAALEKEKLFVSEDSVLVAAGRCKDGVAVGANAVADRGPSRRKAVEDAGSTEEDGEGRGTDEEARRTYDGSRRNPSKPSGKTGGQGKREKCHAKGRSRVGESSVKKGRIAWEVEEAFGEEQRERECEN